MNLIRPGIHQLEPGQVQGPGGRPLVPPWQHRGPGLMFLVTIDAFNWCQSTAFNDVVTIEEQKFSEQKELPNWQRDILCTKTTLTKAQWCSSVPSLRNQVQHDGVHVWKVPTSPKTSRRHMKLRESHSSAVSAALKIITDTRWGSTARLPMKVWGTAVSTTGDMSLWRAASSRSTASLATHKKIKHNKI